MLCDIALFYLVAFTACIMQHYFIRLVPRLLGRGESLGLKATQN